MGLLAIMTPHFWQQTENYITEKSGENVAMKVLILDGRNGKIQHFRQNFYEICVILRSKNDIFGAKILQCPLFCGCDLWWVLTTNVRTNCEGTSSILQCLVITSEHVKGARKQMGLLPSYCLNGP